MKLEAPFIKNLDMQLICNASWRHDGPPAASLVFVMGLVCHFCPSSIICGVKMSAPGQQQAAFCCQL